MICFVLSIDSPWLISQVSHPPTYRLEICLKGPISLVSEAFEVFNVSAQCGIVQKQRIWQNRAVPITS